MTNQNEMQLQQQSLQPFEVRGEVQQVDGKYQRKASEYAAYCSVVATTQEEKIALFNLMNGSDDTVVQFKNAMNAEFEIAHCITSPYTSVDEETGELTEGVSVVLIATNGSKFATTSKTVYYTLGNLFKAFGFPGTQGYVPIKVKIGQKPGLTNSRKVVTIAPIV